MIALEVFLARRDLLDQGKHLWMVLIDEHEGRVEHLRERLADVLVSHGQPKPPSLHLRTGVGKCGDVLQGELTRANAFGQPIFAVLDSFGGPDVPFDLLQAIAANKSSEVLVTFGTTFLTRFGEVDQHRQSGDRAFGGTHWQAVSGRSPKAKKTFLVDSYRATLRTAGFVHSLTFEMVDEAGHALFLIFGTNNPRGLEKMKDALWKVDPLSGVSYRDPRDENQTLLHLVADPDKALLGRMLLTQMTDAAWTVERLREYALLETVYRPEHVIPTVRGLVKEGAIATVPPGKGIVKATVVRQSARGVPPSTAPAAEELPLF